MDYTENICVEVYKENPYDVRYAIYDSETGELLEDAQGYGYKSKDKALRGWKFLKAKHFKTTKEKNDEADKMALGNIVWNALGREVHEESYDVFYMFINDHKDELANAISEAMRNEVAEQCSMQLPIAK
jgi:hypothetical protein